MAFMLKDGKFMIEGSAWVTDPDYCDCECVICEKVGRCIWLTISSLSDPNEPPGYIPPQPPTGSVNWHYHGHVKDTKTTPNGSDYHVHLFIGQECGDIPVDWYHLDLPGESDALLPLNWRSSSDVAATTDDAGCTDAIRDQLKVLHLVTGWHNQPTPDFVEDLQDDPITDCCS